MSGTRSGGKIRRSRSRKRRVIGIRRKRRTGTGIGTGTSHEVVTAIRMHELMMSAYRRP